MSVLRAIIRAITVTFLVVGIALQIMFGYDRPHQQQPMEIAPNEPSVHP